MAKLKKSPLARLFAVLRRLKHGVFSSVRGTSDQPINWSARPKLLSIRDTADLLGVHPNTLRQWGEQGKLKTIRLGARRDRRYEREQVAELVAARQITRIPAVRSAWASTVLARRQMIQRFAVVAGVAAIVVGLGSYTSSVFARDENAVKVTQPAACGGWRQVGTTTLQAKPSSKFNLNRSVSILADDLRVSPDSDGTARSNLNAVDPILDCTHFGPLLGSDVLAESYTLRLRSSIEAQAGSRDAYIVEWSPDGAAWTLVGVVVPDGTGVKNLVYPLRSNAPIDLHALHVRVRLENDPLGPSSSMAIDTLAVEVLSRQIASGAAAGANSLDNLVTFSKQVYFAGEQPSISVPKTHERRLFGLKVGQDVWQFESLTVRDVSGQVVPIEPFQHQEQRGSDTVEVFLLPTEKLHPGKFTVTVVQRSSRGERASTTKTFTWGVLAMNVSIASPRPGDIQGVTMGVLDDAGHTICDASLRLFVTDPQGKRTEYSTKRKTITTNSRCVDKGFTLKPDYQAFFKLAAAGSYHLRLESTTASGLRVYEDNFVVGDSPQFLVERTDYPSRIYPVARYAVRISITPQRDYVGMVNETLPAGFLVSDISPTPTQRTAVDANSQTIGWSVEWKQGETHYLTYTFDAPDISPALFTAGPLTIGGGFNLKPQFQEPRQWQIASDALIKKTKDQIKFTPLPETVNDWVKDQPALVSVAKSLFQSDEQVTVKLWSDGFTLPGKSTTAKITSYEVVPPNGANAGFDEADDLLKKDGRERTILYLVPNSHFQPGTYKVNITVEEGGVVRRQSVAFPWGAVDVHLPAGKHLVNDRLEVGITSADANGFIDCGTPLVVTVTSPRNKQTTYETSAGTIDQPAGCRALRGTAVADYMVPIVPDVTGTYRITARRADSDRTLEAERTLIIGDRPAPPDKIKKEIEGSVHAAKKFYKASEKPSIQVDTVTASGFLGRTITNRTITAVKLVDPSTKEAVVSPTMNETAEGSNVTTNVVFDTKQLVRPGKYNAVMTVVQNGFAQQITQDFTWGVLDVNVRRSYSPSNSPIEVAMSVLDDEGRTQCDAAVQLDITDPQGKKRHFATDDHSIVIDPDCVDRGITIKPDYGAMYTTGGPGRYVMTVTATIRNGTRSITDSFQVDDTQPFDVERTTFPTRIYPAPAYPVSFTITAKQDYAGPVVETMTSRFALSDISDAGISTTPDPATKIITWNVDWKAGKTYTLGYTIDFPKIAPEFYVLGPLQIGGFKEARQWQIASDASSCTLSYSAAANWTTAAWATCASSYPGATVSGDTASITNVTTGATLTLNTSITANALGSLTINANGVASTLALGANTLTVNGTVTVTQPSAAVTTTLSMTSGSLIIQNSNNLAMAGTTTTASTIATVTVTTGLLDVGGSITYTATASMPAGNKLVSLNNTGTIRVRGAETLNCGTLRNATTAGTLQFDSLLTIGSATCASATTFSTLANSTVKIGAGLTTVASSSPTVTFNATSVANFTGSGTITPSAGTLTFGKVLIDSGAVVTLAGNVTVAATGTTAFVNNNTTGSWTGAQTTTFSGAAPTVVGDTTFSTLTTTGASTNFTVGANTTVTVTNNYSDAQGAGVTKLDLNTNSGAALSIGGTMTIRNSSGASTNTYNVGQGTLTVTGEIIWTGTSATASRIGSLSLTSGTINANGGIDTTGTPATCNGCNNINISGGAGHFYLKGHVQANNVNEGASGWVFTNSTCTSGGGEFVYQDTAAQTVYFPSSGGYCNLTILNTNAAGATLNGNITTTNLKGNLTVGESGGSVAATLNLNNKTIAGNGTATMFIYNTATVVQIGATGGSFPSGFGTFTFASNSNYNFTTSGTTTAIGAITYGNVNFVPSTTVTFTLPAGTVNVGGSLTIGNGTNTSVLRDQINGTTLNVTGDFTMSNNSQFTADTTNAVTVGGNFSIGATSTTFNHNNGTFIFNGTTGTDTIDTDAQSFYNVTFNGSGGSWKPVNNNITIANDLTMTAGTLQGNGALNLTVNGNVQCGASCGTIDMTANTGTGAFTQNVAAAESFGTSVTADTTGWTFYDLTFSSSAGSNTITASGTPTSPGAVTIKHVLSIGANTTFDAGSNGRTWSLWGSGTPLVNAGTLTGNNSTIRYQDIGGLATTVTATANTNYDNLDLRQVSTSATYTIGSAAGQTLNVLGDLVTSGLSGGVLTVDCVGTAYNPSISINGNLTLNASTVWTKGSGTLTMDSVAGSVNLADNNATKQDLGALVIGDGATAKSVSMTTNITVTSINVTAAATLVAPSGTLKVSGDWTNSGTFTHNSGTVELNGTAQQALSGTLSGATGKFNNLTVTNAFGDGSSTFSATFAGNAETAATFTAATANTKLRFNATSTYTFQNFTVNGLATGTRVYLRSSTGASAWLLNVAGTATVSYANVMDSDATGSAAPIDASDGTSFNATGNTNWNFVATISVSGTIFQSGAEGSAFDCSGANNISLHVAVNGGANANGTCSAVGGTFTITGVTAPSGADIPVVVYSDSASSNKLTTVTLSSGTGSISGLTLIIGRVVVSQESATAITNTLLNTADNTNAGIRYAVSGGNLSVETGLELHILAGKTFTPGGNVTTAPSSNAALTDGDVHIPATATLALGANALSIGGHLVNAGSLTSSAGSSVTFTSTASGTQTIDTGGATLQDLTLNNASGHWTNVGALTIAGNFSLTAGEFTQANSTTMTVNGTSFTIANGATWTKATSGANLILENGTNLSFADNNTTKQDLGVVQIGASPGTTTLTTDMSATTVTIPNGDTFNTKGYDVTTTGAFACNGTCTLDLTDTAPNNETDGTILDVGGDFTMSGTATFTAYTNSTLFMNSTATANTNRVWTTGDKTYNHVELKNAGTTNDAIEPNGNVDVNGNFTLTDGYIDGSANPPVDVTLAGNLSISANAQYVSGGTWTFDGSGTSTWTDSTSAVQNLGEVTVNGTTKTVNLGSSAKATKLIIAASQTFGLGSSGYTFTLTDSGTGVSRPLQNSGTLNEGTDSTFKYTGIAATDMYSEDYDNLTIAPASGSPTYNMGPDGTGTFSVAGLLTVGDATNAVTLDTNWDEAQTLNDVTIANAATWYTNAIVGQSMDGSLVSNGTLTINDGLSFTATTTGKTISGSTLTTTGALTAVTFAGSGGGWTINNDTKFGGFTLTAGVVTQGANVNLTVENVWSMSLGTTFTKASGSGTITFNGTTAATFTDSTASKQNLGKVAITKTNGTPSNNKITLASGMLVDTLTISASNTLDLANAGYVLEVANQGATATPLVVTGTLTPNSSSTVKFSATNASGLITVPVQTYASLDCSPSATESCTIASSLTVGENLTVGSNGTLSINAGQTVTQTTGTLTLNGTISGGGSTFEYQSATAFPATGTISNTLRMNAINNAQSLACSGGGGRTFGGAVEFYNGHASTARTITLCNAAAQVANFSSTVSVNGAGGGALTLEVNTNDPTVNITGNLTAGTAGGGAETVSMGSGTWTMSGDVTFTNATVSNTTSGTIIMDGTGGKTFAGNNQTYNNLRFTPSATNTINIRTSQVNLGGVFEVGANTTIDSDQTINMNQATCSLTLPASGTIQGTGTMWYDCSSNTFPNTGTFNLAGMWFVAYYGNMTIPARTFGGTSLFRILNGSGVSRTVYMASGTINISAPFNVYTQSGSNLIVDASNGGANNPTVNLSSGIDFTVTGAETRTLITGTGTWTVAGNANFTNATVTATAGNIWAMTGASKTLTSAGNALSNFTNAGTITMSGAASVAGNLLISSGTLTAPSAANLTVGNDFTNNSTFTHNSGTVIMTGSSNNIAGSSTTTFNNLTISGTTITVAAGGSDLTVAGTLAVDDAKTLSIGSSRTVTMSANTGTTVNLNTSGTVSGSGTLKYQNSATTITTAGTISSGFTFDVLNGNMTVPNRTFGGLVTGSNTTATGRTLTVATSSTPTFTGLDLKTTGTGTLLFDAATNNPATVTVTGNLTASAANGAITLSLGTGNWSVSGNFDLTNVTTFNHNSGTVTMTGASKTLTTNGKTLNNLTFSGTGTTTLADAVAAAGNVTLNSTITAGSLTMSGATKNLVGGTATLTNLTINGNTTLQTSNLTVSSALSIGNSTTLTIDTVTLTDTGTTDVAWGTSSVITGTGKLTFTSSTTGGPGTSGTLSSQVVFDASAANIPSAVFDARTYGGLVTFFASSGTAKSITAAAGGYTFSSGVTTSAGGAGVVTADLGAATGTTAITGTLTIGATTAVTAPSSLSVSGSFANSGTFTHNSGTLNMTGTGTLTSNGNTLNNLTISNASGTVTLANATHTLVGNLLLNGAGALTAGTSTIAMTGSAKTIDGGGKTLSGLTISDNTTLQNTDLSVSGALNVADTKTLTINASRNLTVTTAGSLTFNSTGTITSPSTGTLIYQPSTTFPTGGTISSQLRMDATSNNQTLSQRTYGGQVEFYSSSGSTRTVTLGTAGSQTLGFSGNFHVNAAGIGDITISGDGNNPTINIAGNLDFTGTTAGLEVIAAGAGTWTVSGNADFTNGVYGPSVAALTPTAADTAEFNRYADSFSGCALFDTYYCLGSGTINYGKTDTGACIDSSLDQTIVTDRGWMEYNPTGISDSATIIGAQIGAWVNGGYTAAISVGRSTVDDLAGQDCTASGGTYSKINGAQYGTVSLSSVGNKMIPLGTTGVADIQSRITGTTARLSIGLNTSSVEASMAGIAGLVGSYPALYASYYVSGTPTFVMNGASTTLTSGGNSFYNLALSNSITLSGETHTVANNLDMTAGTITPGSSTVTMTGTAGTLTGPSSGSLNNLTIDPSSAGTITQSGDLSVGGLLTVATGDTLSIPTTKTLTLTATTGSTLSNAGTISGAGRLTYKTTTAFPATGVISSILRMDASNGDQTIGGTNSATRTFGGLVEIYNNSGSTNRTVTFENGTARTFTFSGSLNLIADSATNNVTLTADTTTDPTVNVAGDLDFTGTLAGTEILVSGTGTWTVSGAVNFTDGTFTASTGTLVMNGASKTLTTNGQTLSNLTFSGTGTTTLADNITATGNVVLNNTVSAGSTTLTMSGTSKTLTGASATINHLSTSGTIALSGVLTLNGNLSITAGTLTADSASAFTVKGNWSNAGTFAEGTGTVTLAGLTSTTIDSGCANTDSCANQNFYNLIINKTDAADGNDNVTLTTNGINVANTLTITDGELVQGALNVRAEGAASAVSIGASGKWSNISTGDIKLGGPFANAGTLYLDVQGNNDGCGGGDTDDISWTSTDTNPRTISGAGTFTLYDVTVDYLNASVAITVNGGSDGTHNTGSWTFNGCGIIVSGTCDQFDQTTDCTDDGSNEIRVAVNGTLKTEKDTTVDGAWSISSVPGIVSGDIITVFINTQADANEAVAVTKYDGTGDITGITLFQRHLTIGSVDNPTITNTDLGQYDNSVSGDEDVFHEVTAGNDLTVDYEPGGTGQYTDDELYIKSGATFRPASAGGGDVTMNNLENVGTLTADTNSITVGGSWLNSGTFTKSATQTTTFTATSAGFTITPNANNFANLVFNGASGVWTAQAAIVVDENLTVTAGTFALAANALTVGSTGVANSGNIKVASAQSLTQTSGSTTTIKSSASGANCIGSNGASCAGTAGTISLGALTIGDAATTFTTTFGGTTPTLTVANTLTITANATFTAGASTVNVGGSFTNNGTVSQTGGTLVMNGTGTLTTNGNTLNNFTTSGGGTITLANATHTFAGNVDLGSTGHTSGTSTIVMSGNSTNLTGHNHALYNLNITGTPVTITGSVVIISRTLTVGSGKTLTINSGLGVYLNGTIVASLSISGATINGAGTLYYNNSNTNFPSNGTINSNVEFSPVVGDITVNAQNFGANVTCTDSGSAGSCIFGAGTFGIAGDLIVQDLGIGITLNFSGNPTVNLAGSLSGVNNGGPTVLSMGSGAWTVSGNFDLSPFTTVNHNSGSLTMNGTGKTLTSVGFTLYNVTLSGTITLDDSLGDHRVAGDLTLSGTVNPQTSLVRMTGVGKNLTGGGNSLNTLYVDPSSAGTITLTGSNLTISAQLNIFTGDTFSIASTKSVTLVPGATLVLTGSITGAGTLIYQPTTAFPTGTISSILRMDATNGAQTIAGTNSATRTFGGLVEIYNNSNLIGRTVTLENGTARTYAFAGGLNLIANDAQNITLTADTATDPTVTVTGTVDFTGGGAGTEVIESGSGTWSVSGDVNFFGGTYTATSGNTLALNGAAQQTLTTAGNSLNNLTVTNASGSDPDSSPSVIFADGFTTTGTFTAGTANTKLRFLAGATYTINTLTLAGTAGNFVTIRSSSPGTTAAISAGAGARSVTYTSIQDNDACGSTGGSIDASSPATNEDKGNTPCWITRTLTASLSATAADLGTLTAANVSQAGIISTVTTNAATGYISLVKYDQVLTAGSNTIGNTAGGTIVAGESEYGASSSQAGNTISQWSPAACATTGTTSTASPLSTSFQSFASKSSAASAEATTLCLLSSTTSTQAPGSYQSTLTIVTTARY